MKNPNLSSIAALLLSAAACSGSKELVCSTDQQVCANACTSVRSDAQNCGACGRACGAGQGCSAGTCVDCAADPAACTAVVAAACFNTNEVRFLGEDLAQVGPALAVGRGPIAFGQAGGALAVADSLSSDVTPIALAPLTARPAIPIAFPTGGYADLEGMSGSGGLFFVSNAAAGTLVVVDPAGSRVVTELPLAEAPGEAVNPKGIAFAAGKAYVALYNAGSRSAVAVVDLGAGASPTIRKRIDVTAYATGNAVAGPTRVLAANGKVYVTLSNVRDASVVQVGGAHGKLVVIDPATDAVVGDTALDLGPDCLSAGALALSGSTLWVGCGFYDLRSVQGAGLLPVSIAGATPQPGAIVKTSSAIAALAVCGGRGYAGAAESGTVLSFDVSTGAVSASANACATAGNFVPDLACLR